MPGETVIRRNDLNSEMSVPEDPRHAGGYLGTRKVSELVRVHLNPNLPDLSVEGKGAG
jgi:hypothetical protein